LPGKDDNSKKEFLADIASFANADGGMIFYGISQTKDGIFKSLNGIEGVNQDDEILRLESIILSAIKPRIQGVHTTSIEISPNKFVFIIKIPKSWAAPHMITLQHTSERFWSRISKGKYPMDIIEIKDAFLRSDAIPQRIRGFRLERIQNITGDRPILTKYYPRSLMVHLIPLSAFSTNTLFPLPSPEFNKLIPLDGSVFPIENRYSIEGLRFTVKDINGYIRAYSTIHRNGIIESACNTMIEQSELSEYFEQPIIKFIHDALDYQHQIGVEPPVFCLLSLIAVSGITFARGGVLSRRAIDKYNRGIEDERILTPEIVFEDFSITDIAAILKPSFDIVWNAVGWPSSQNYDEEGRWKFNSEAVFRGDFY
jgi:hypothetical protein